MDGNGPSFNAAASADGRVVAFVSAASNLTSDDDGSSTDIFVRNVAQGRTTRVVFRNDGGMSGVDHPPSLSASGRFLAFQGQADDLVPGDTNGVRDLFVWDLSTGATERVNLSSTEGEADDEADGSSMSGTGRYVAFYSTATNLVPGDTNDARDIFVRDRQLGLTERVSVATDGRQANGVSNDASISADGRFVTFWSWATNLVPDHDTGQVVNVFIRDRWRGTTDLVSVGTSGEPGNENSDATSISADGRFVAFRSAASNLVPGVGDGHYHVFVRDLQGGTTRQVDLATSGAQAEGDADSPHISADGHFVTFNSWAPNLAPRDTNSDYDVFVRDLRRHVTIPAGLSTCGGPADIGTYGAAISGDGRYVTLVSGASNLVPHDTNRALDVYVRDMRLGTIHRMSVGVAPASTRTRR